MKILVKIISPFLFWGPQPSIFSYAVLYSKGNGSRKGGNSRVGYSFEGFFTCLTGEIRADNLWI